MLRPTVVKVEPRDGYILFLEFDNGEQKLFDVTPYIKGDYYGELADMEYFQLVKANGFTVEWPNEQDICPDELYEDSVGI